MMRTRLERDVGGCATGIAANALECVHFGVGSTGFAMPAFADNGVVSYQHAANARIWMGRVQTTACEAQRPCHVFIVCRSVLRHG